MSGSAILIRSSSKMAFSDEDILRTLMQSRNRIAAAAWVVVHDAQAAEDIFQNVALKALTKEVRFESAGSVLSWAFITARREGIDWLRRHRNETAGLDTDILDLLEQDWLSEDTSHGNARMAALQECLEAIPDKSRRLLQLRYFQGYSCREIAERLGAGVDAIYKRLSRLHASLGVCIEKRLSETEVTES
jgi:RNA polymerase sigma-70 factor (ECF subfamily)